MMELGTGQPSCGKTVLSLSSIKQVGLCRVINCINNLLLAGRIIWNREEALTRINVVDFVGLPSAHYGSQAFPMMQQEKEQGGNTLTMVVQRFYGQLLQIQVSNVCCVVAAGELAIGLCISVA